MPAPTGIVDETVYTHQLFVSVSDPETSRTQANWENYPSIGSALADLMAWCAEEQWLVTPGIEDDEIVYRITGDDITDGLATISALS